MYSVVRSTSLDNRPAQEAGQRPYLSVIIPVYNEEPSVSLIIERLFAVLGAIGKRFEVIAVNDGSRDRSLALLREQAGLRPELRVVDFRRNYGQTAAMMAGIDHSEGDVIISIDADLQNDPEDIPKLLQKLDEGYDVVSGWRRERKDAPLRRNLVSRVANRLISQISGVRLHDYGCTLKAYRADVIKGVRLYGEMHRFIPIFATWMGAKVAEIPVTHHARPYGQSNYGLERVAKVLLDLIVVKFLDRHFAKPMYVFGGFGALALLFGSASFTYMMVLKLFEGISIISTPLPLVTVMSVLTGVSSILMGLVAEMIVRTYFESQQRPHYSVRERINFERRD